MQPLLQLASEVDSDDEIERMQLEQMNESSSATPRAPPPMPQQGPSQQQLKDTATWLKIYPVYFDSLKSKAEGRRIPKEYAFPDPSSIYIIEAIQRLNLQVIYENEKRHPRDPLLFGRCRVNAGRSKWSKNTLMKEIGRLIRDTDIIKEVDAREGDMMVQILAQTRSHIIGPLEGAPGMGMPAVAAAPSKGKGKNK